MRLEILLLIVLLIFTGYMLATQNIDHFFNNNSSISVAWVSVPGAASYNWKVCNTSTCDPNPDNWPGNPQNSTTNSATLNSTTCPGCDFGASIQFAVQTVGSNGLNSTWTTITIDLHSYLKVNQQHMINSAANQTPPKAGDTSSLYQIAFVQPIPQGMYEKNFAYVTLVRGGTTYYYKSPVQYSTLPNKSFYAVQTTIDYSAANTNWNVPIPGGALVAGDIITVESLFANIGVSGPTWPPPNDNGPVYYFGSYQVTSQAPPAAPGTLTWQVN